MSFRDSLKETLSLSPLNLVGTAKALSSFLPAPGGSGGLGWYGLLGTGSRIDFAGEVGPVQNLSMAQAAINWVSRGLNSARLYVAEVGADEKETEVQGHELAKLFHRPNPIYSGSVLFAGLALSWVTYATAYVLVMKNRLGQPAELWWEPHWTIRPRWPQNGSETISYYEVLRNGVWIRIGKGSAYENVEPLVIRDGWNPATRCGWNSMTSLMTEFYTDKKAAMFMAQLMRAGLVPPLIVSLGSKEIPWVDTPDGSKTKEVKANLIRKTSGDDAGQPMVISGPVEVNKLGFDYSAVGLKDIRQIPVTRFCAALGISPISLHLDAGDSTHANYNNVQGYLKHDYQTYIVGLQDIIADEIDRMLLPMFGGENQRCVWDYSRVPLMQQDKTAETKRTTLIYIAGGIDRAEYREANDYKMREEDKDIYYEGSKPPKPPSVPGFPQALGVSGNDPANPLGDQSQKSWMDFIDATDLEDGLDWWKQNAPKEARGLAKAVRPNGHAK